MLVRRLIYILLGIVIQASVLSTTADAQRLIRKNSRHYIAEQTLPAAVKPLLTDVWDQFAPFNNYCPVDSTGERCVVGCVATAMTQVMHYWRWPAQGRGSHEYEDSIGCQQTLKADFSQHTYDWDNILDTYKEGEYNETQANAIALLSSDCGISVNMRYGSVSSGAESILQIPALSKYFGYDCGAQMLFRDFYSLEEITYMLKKELAEGRPVLISAYNRNGGHAFVIDGYDENDWFHTCWGNPGGEDNHYTYLPHMIPNQPQWYTKGSGENGFNILQMFTVGLMPENHPKATGIERHNFAFQYINAITDSTMEAAKYSRDDVRLTIHDMSNIGWNLHEDSVSLMLQKDGKIVCPIYTYDHEFLLEEIEDTTYTDSLSLKIPADVTDGTYTLVPMFKDNALDGGKEWREARVCVGTPNYLLATIKDNEVTLASDTASSSYLTLEDIALPDMIVNGTYPFYGITLKNHGPEMAGRVYFMLERVDNGASFYIQMQGVTIGANEEYSIFNNLRKISATPGNYRLHIYYEKNLFSDELIELELPEENIIYLCPANNLEIARR